MLMQKASARQWRHSHSQPSKPDTTHICCDANAAPPSRPAPAAAPSKSLSQQLLGWAAAWSARDLARYKSYYAKSFTPEKGRSMDQWVSESQARLNKPGEINLAISEFKTTPLDADKTTTEFKQTYNHGKDHDVESKRLEWVREGNR